MCIMSSNHDQNKASKNKVTIDSYNKNANQYSQIFSKYKSKIGDIKRAFKLNTSDDSRTLEIGCGAGMDATDIIAEIGADNYFGFDPAENFIIEARKKNPGSVFHVKTMEGALAELKDEGFGVIFAFYSMLHVNREDLAKVIPGYLKKLKTGGILYVSGKYGDYKEIEIKNFGDAKYYYSYKPEEIEGWVVGQCETVYKIINDTDYGPSFTLALRKK